jgi:hypothetical protein
MPEVDSSMGGFERWVRKNELAIIAASICQKEESREIMTKESAINNPLGVLINLELSSIEFVRDYLQFHFDGPVLNVYTDPELIANGQVYKRSSSEFCNLVLKCISQAVISASVIEDDEIKISFANGFVIKIPLSPEGYTDPESAVFTGDKPENWWVW